MRLHTIILLGLVLCLTSGCESMLPMAKSKDESRWESFEQVKASFDQITPLVSTKTDLQKLGFDPYQTANIQILNYLAIIQKFMPNTNITMSDLPPGLQACIEAKDSCVAYELKAQNIQSQRQGSVFLDLLRFKRQAHQTGWRFYAFIVLVDDLVVYKLWDGQPRIEGEVFKKNPLGPLQEPVDIVTDPAVISTF